VAAVARRTLALAAALALLSAACTRAGGDSMPTGGTGTSAPALTSPTGAGSTAAAAGAPVELVTVFDGDTVLVLLDGAEEEIRLLGVNTPEREECFSSQAREATASLLETVPLRVEIIGGRDQFGRLLAYAHAGGTLVNRALVEGGCALALDTDHPRRAEFLAAEERAYAARAGLWAADACGPPSPAVLALVDVEPDPPGPDEDDLNGEWARLANQGAETADLTGWVLRDESSQNRYLFPDGFLLPSGGEVAVHTGCGADGRVDLHWCADGPVWNNGGDAALLLDPAGNVAARLRYPG
jgi:endonuclease YncB( thermonuclease family)